VFEGQFEGILFAQELCVLVWKIEDLKAYNEDLAPELFLLV